jgi:preprotein translocase subunit SecE
MTAEEDAKRERANPDEGGPRPEAEADEEGSAPTSEGPAADEGTDTAEALADRAEPEEASPVAPTQMGARRFVYAAYFAAAIGVAFLTSKALDFAWVKVQSYKPAIGEPSDEVIMPISAIVGGGTAVYYWYRTKARQLAEEVAAEMAKVTWPSRTEVTNGTVVVIFTTVVATVFFALMDRFWGFITNLVYGGT